MAFGILLLVAIGIYILIDQQSSKQRKQLWSTYQQSLRSSDKRAALAAGRAYYTKLRKGKPSAADEQALTNDLATMS